MTNKTTESYGKNANRAQTERSFKRLLPRSFEVSTSHVRSRCIGKCVSRSTDTSGVNLTLLNMSPT